MCRHLARVADYLWVAEDGLKMQGYNGSQLWDTAFTVQAYAASGLLNGTVAAALTRAHTYIKNTQARPPPPPRPSPAPLPSSGCTRLHC